jgi:hypothetical protein
MTRTAALLSPTVEEIVTRAGSAGASSTDHPVAGKSRIRPTASRIGCC